jgi:hypothetical protein
MKTLHAWFSVKQARLAGTVLYRDANGKTVEVSNITHDKDDHGTKWDDMAYLGEVVEFVGKGTPGELDGLNVDLNELSDEEALKVILKLGAILKRECEAREKEKDPKRWN